MKRAYIFAFTLVVFTYLPASATIINIPDDYLTIQEGIDASTDGDTVLVQPGTYVENVDYNGHSVVLGSLFLITGDTSYIEQTIIDGDSAGSVIRTENYEDSISVVAGFTIQNGYSDMGGGIHSYHSGIHITHNIIRGNVADSLGGGIYCLAPWVGNPQITNNIIENNFSEVGGGICTRFGDADITNNTIVNNHASITGGGLAVQMYGGVSIDGNFIANNVSDSIGGGISFDYRTSPISFNYNQIIGNNSLFYGGGIYWDGTYHIHINNCTIYGNTSSQGGGIYAESGVMRITNSILWADTAFTSNNEIFESSNSQLVVSYSGVQGGWSGHNVLDIDPVFRDPLSYDFHLQDSIDCGDTHYSPYIDAGNPEVLDSPVNCDWGLGSESSDIGAFGGGDFLQHIGVVINIPDDYPTIQEGIDASLERDTIRIAPGIYYELIGVGRKNIVIGSHYMDEGDTSFIYSTIIDGNQLGPIVAISNNDSTSALVGLTIRNGRGWATGGIFLSGGNPTIKNNRIIYNNIMSESYACNGAGVKCIGTSAIITNNTISHNIVEPGVTYHRNGGGISCYGGGSPVISGNDIMYNSAPDYGGGICVGGVIPTIINNRIGFNDAAYGGGVFTSSGDQAIIAGNVVFNNARHGFYGGGKFCNNIIIDNTGSGICIIWGQGTLINNVIYGNQYQYGGGVYGEWSSIDILNCIVRGNTNPQITDYDGTLSVSYCNVEGGHPGEGNIDDYPEFRDIYNGDFHLMSTACGDFEDSPCIDAGSPAILDSLLDCSWGLGRILSDMGAYGGGDSTMVGIDDDKEPEVPIKFGLSQNYPNPFNATTIIRYALPEPADVKIEIFDILGRKVETLIEEKQPAGYHQIVWDANDNSSGMYFYRIEAGEYSDTKKMVLLK